jgi:hypothetical protein
MEMVIEKTREAESCGQQNDEQQQNPAKFPKALR